MGLKTDADMPKELNFAMYGDLTFEIANERYKCQNYIIAQGSVMTRENWWIGSTEC